MRRRILSTCIILSIILYLATDISFAAPIIYRQQRMKAMRQQQEQMEYEQAYQQQQQQQRQQQGAPSQQAADQETYQQKIDQRNQAIAQAILDAHHQSVLSQNPQTTHAIDNQAPQAPATNSVQPIAVQSGSDVVDLAEVWKKLDTKSTIWSALVDNQAKILTVSEYIDRFQKQGVKIQAPPSHYVQEIDQVIIQNPQMLQRPFGELLQIMAIIDYDFDNGMDKDVLARKVLGEAGFEANKKRFTQQSQQTSGGNAGP